MRVLSIDLSDRETYPEHVLTGLNWQTFRYNRTVDPVTHRVVGWESTPMDTAVAELEDTLAAYFAATFGDDTQEERDSNKGRTLVAESYYLALTKGVAMTQNPCPNVQDCKVGVSNSASDLAKGVVAMGKGVNTVAQVLVEEFLIINRQALQQAVNIAERGFMWRGGLIEITEVVNGVSRTRKVTPFEFIATKSGSMSVFFSTKLQAALYTYLFAAGVVIAGAVACLSILLVRAGKTGDWRASIAAVTQTIGVVAACFGVIAAIGKWFKTVSVAGSTKFFKVISSITTQLKNSSTRLSGIMTLVGLGINLAMNVASFLIQYFMGGMRLASAVSTLAASVAVTLIYFFLFTAMGAVGAIVQSLIGLVDVLIGLICNAAGVTAAKDPMLSKWLCGGLTGAIVTGIKSLFYSGSVMVDLQDADRLKTTNFRFWFDGPYGDHNYVGNSAYYAVTVPAKSSWPRRRKTTRMSPPTSPRGPTSTR